MKALRQLQRLARRSAARGRLAWRPGPPVHSVTDAGRPFGVYVDAALRPDAHSALLLGWLWDPALAIERLRLVVDDGQRVWLQPSRYDRPDVLAAYRAAPPATPGFAAFARLARPVALACPLQLELWLGDGRILRVRVPPASTCPFAARSELIAALPGLTGAAATRNDLYHAFDPVLRRCARERRVAADWTLGRPAAQPELSIVVPLFGELDLLDSQLAEFAADPDLWRRAELIYVLDAPEQCEHVQRLSRQLFGFYAVPTRWLALANHAGFAGATNEGARHARGRLLLLLNSDVIPPQAGWADRLIDAWRTRPGPGALGPKLLYEDGSLQHAGLYWARDWLRLGEHAARPVDVELWFNHQYYKGYPGDLPAANVAREVPALTGACLLTDARLYDELGGLDEAYVQGDCEDSDLCLRIAARGREIRYEPAIELYHLEGQSYPSAVRRRLGAYNIWLQDRRWGAAMAARMAAFPGLAPADEAGPRPGHGSP